MMDFAITDYSPDCASNISDALSKIKEMIYTEEGRNYLNTVFKIQPPLNVSASDSFELDASHFLAYIFRSFQGVVQYSFDALNNYTMNGYGIDGLCEIMTTKEESVSKIAKFYFLFKAVTYLDNDYNRDISHISKNTYNLSNPYDFNGNSADRGWVWICCGMAMGLLQSAESSHTIFNRMLPLQYYFQLCQDVFGPTINTTYITKKVEETIYHFGNPWNYSASNVVLVNGGYDPWSALGSKVTRKDQHQIAIQIPKAAHCSDMYPARNGEPIALKAAREAIENELDYFIKNAAVPTTLMPSTPTTSSLVVTTSDSSTPMKSNVATSFLLCVILFLFGKFFV
uniref:Uncharacterized protein n=1 Tax=Panagrolaimus davidi TaxID=227884 RepID=A0A914Q9Y4_9BILA